MDARGKVRYHRLVEGDLIRTFEYYHEEAGRELAECFFEEWQRRIGEAVLNPGRFHPVTAGLRRVNLRRFPYHFLFRRSLEGITILVLRHNRSHPNRGLNRQ